VVTALYVILALYSLTISTWLFYLAIMSLRRKKNDLSLTAKILAYQLLPAGLILDTLFNWLVGTICFVEFPRECLFTARCDRWLKAITWRGKVARFWCRNFLDPFQDEGHCK
jgi:hypothetical protein